MTAVIGGEGFIGSYLARVLRRQGMSFRTYDIDPQENAFKLDVRSCSDVDLPSDITRIVNLAAVHRDDVQPTSLYQAVNVDGARQVCDLARKNGICQIVFTSSVAVFGFAAPNTDEDGVHEYFNEYGRSKHLAEQVYLSWQMEDPENRSLVIVRPTVVFGPGNRGNVYNLLRQIASKKFVMLGSGRNIKSMAYVENLVSFIVHTFTFGPGVHVYNYIDKPDLTMNELVLVAKDTLFNKPSIGIRLPASFGLFVGHCFDAAARIIGRPLPISRIRVKKFMATTQFNSAAIEAGFKAPYTLAEGLEKTLR